MPPSLVFSDFFLCRYPSKAFESPERGGSRSADGDGEENEAAAAEKEEDRGAGGRDEDGDNSRRGIGGRQGGGGETAGAGEVSGTAGSVKGEGKSQEEEAAPPPPPPVTVDWMGRVETHHVRAPEVLSPFAAARRERILMLPGWVRALKPWGDLLQV